MIFPTFYFKPIKLQEEVRKLQVKYKYTDHISGNLIQRKLPNLLERIRMLGDSESEIIQFAKGLKPIDINILASEYPYEKEELTTQSKILVILNERYNRIVGRRFWNHYQHSPFDERIILLLQYAFKEEDPNFLGLNPSIRDKYNNVFSNSDFNSVLKELANQIEVNKSILEIMTSKWKIVKNTKLAYELLLIILEIHMKTPGFVELQGADTIGDKLNNINLQRYKKIIVNYLNAFESEEYHHVLFSQVINRLNDPRKNRARWSDVPEETIQKVKSRLIRDELFDFFDSDSERFDYWRKYINHIKSVDFNAEPPIAAMYFGNFVVVEFALVGNAAYFYEAEGFSKYLAHKIKRDISESELKDRDVYYFINKLNHAGKWQTRYDQYMVNYLNGNLHYRH